MNHFEFGFFDELEKIATVEDGTLSLPKKVRYSTSIPNPRVKAAYKAAKRAYADKAEMSSPLHAGIAGSSIAAGLAASPSAFDGTMAGIIAHQTLGIPAARAVGSIAGRASHAINRFQRINRANKYLEGRRSARELR